MGKGVLGRTIMIAMAVLACSGGTAKSSASQSATSTRSLADLAWMAGDWQTAAGTRQTDEHWTAPLGGAMLGASRTVASGSMVEFEYLRIVQREDGIFYVAHPQARTPGTEFRLTHLSAGRAVFENPQHDFPKRIVYQRNADGSMTASVDAGEGTRGPSFLYLRMGR